MNINSLTISKHAKERYSERIMDKNGFRDVFVFMSENEEKICKDIRKMVEYAELIYRGPSITFGKDSKSCETEVYLNGTWVIIVSPTNNNVITLFSIDLGLGEDFNKDYIQRLMERIKDAKFKKSESETRVLEEIYNYEDLINQNNEQIKEYRGLIRGLEELNSSYKEVASGLKVEIEKADKEVRDAVARLIGKKVF